MKLNLAFAVMGVLLLAACDVDKNNGANGSDDDSTCGDSVGVVNWVYKNSTDREIKIESFYKDTKTNDYKMDLSFSITASNEHEIKEVILFGAFKTPFQWEISSGDRYLVISNGQKQIIQEYSKTPSRRTLYTIYSYVKSNPNDELYYTYTFTNEDFKNAEPME